MENAKTRAKAAFEFMSKLGIRHYTYHDVYVKLFSTFKSVCILYGLLVEFSKGVLMFSILLYGIFLHFKNIFV